MVNEKVYKTKIPLWHIEKEYMIAQGTFIIAKNYEGLTGDLETQSKIVYFRLAKEKYSQVCYTSIVRLEETDMSLETFKLLYE